MAFRAFGRLPPLIFSLWLGICLVQEPDFFRHQGIDLFWRAGDASLIILGFCLVSVAAETPRPRVDVWACCSALWVGVGSLAAGGAVLILAAEWLYAGRVDWGWLTHLAAHVVLVLLPLVPCSIVLSRTRLQALPRYLASTALLTVSLGVQGFYVEPADALSANFVSSVLLGLGVMLLGPVLRRNYSASVRQPNAHRDLG